MSRKSRHHESDCEQETDHPLVPKAISGTVVTAAAATSSVTAAGKRILTEESESTRGKLRLTFSNMLWSLRNVVAVNLLKTTVASTDRVSRLEHLQTSGGSCGSSSGVNEGATKKLSSATQTNFDSSSSEEEEDFSCFVCERSFVTARQLEKHQLKKRHWGCGECNKRFKSRMLLEYHQDESNHWAEEDLPYDSEDSDLDSLRECMNDDRLEEDGSTDEEKEMLL